MRPSPRKTTGLLGAALLACLLPAAGPPAEIPGAAGVEVARLVRELGADSQRVRDKAEATLLLLTEAEPILRRRAGTGDAEVSRRVRRILGRIDSRRTNAALARARRAGRAGHADLLAECLAGPLPKEALRGHCREVVDLALSVIDHADRVIPRVNNKEYYARYLSLRMKNEFADRIRLCDNPLVDIAPCQAWGNVSLSRAAALKTDQGVVHGGSVSLGFRSSCCLVIAARGARLFQTHNIVAFSGGDIDIDRKAWGANIFVCDGDFISRRVKKYDGCIIIARGSVRGLHAVNNCMILAGGDIAFVKGESSASNSFFCCGGKFVRLPKPYSFRRDCRIKEGVAAPFGPIRFFETKDAGFVALAGRAGLRVVSAEAAMPFARAGLRPGDLLTEFDGKPVRDPQTLRRLVRRRVAEGGTASLLIKRGDKRLTLRVQMPD